MHSLFYKLGATQALKELGIKVGEELDEKGTPFPQKSQVIGAERLAQILQQQEDEPDTTSPENFRRDKLNRPVSWQSPINLGGLDQGHGVAGLMVPGSPRG